MANHNLGILIDCESCRKTIRRTPHQLKKNSHNFCSKRCYGDWKGGRPDGAEGRYIARQKNCPQCGMSFFGYTATCSQKCAARHFPNASLKHGKAAKRLKRCAHCKSEFLGHDGNTYCSRRCKGKDKGPKLFHGPAGEALRERYRIENSGEGNRNWKGGRSLLPYTLGWNRARSRQIIKRDGGKCVACKATTRLVVHHRDFGKTDHSDENLITLCQRCHIRLHHHKWTLLY